jgi:hypothetical protein
MASESDEAPPWTPAGTEEVGAEGFTAVGFDTDISSTLVEVEDVAVKGVHLADGSVNGSDRVLDMVDDDGSLDGASFKRVHAKDLNRGFFRVRDAKNVLVEDVIAEARTSPTDHYPTGFATSDLPTEDLTYRRAVARGFEGKPGASYTNGDGWAQEEKSVGTVLEDCASYDNADAGFDMKGELEARRLLAEGNYRNLRLWGSFDVTDFTSIDPSNAHIWLGGGDRLKGGTITRPTFIGGSDEPHIKIDSNTPAVTVTIVDPVVPAGETLRIEKEDGAKATVVVRYTTDDERGVLAQRPAAPAM